MQFQRYVSAKEYKLLRKQEVVRFFNDIALF